VSWAIDEKDYSQRRPAPLRRAEVCRHRTRRGDDGASRAGAHRGHVAVGSRVPKLDAVIAGEESRTCSQRQWHGVHLDGDPGLATGAGVDWHYIQPGKPIQNAFVESFNGRCATSVSTRPHSVARPCRELIVEWRDDYNGHRLTPARGLTPAEFATRSNQARVNTQSVAVYQKTSP